MAYAARQKGVPPRAYLWQGPGFYTIKLGTNVFSNSRKSAHIDARYHRLRHEVVNKRTIRFVYCPTADQAADALTKPLPKDANMRIATLLLGQDFLAVQRIVEKLAGDIPVVQNINYASLHCGGV